MSNYDFESEYKFPKYDPSKPAVAAGAASKTAQSAGGAAAGGAAAAGSGMDWAGGGAVAAGSAVSGIIQAMFQAEQERRVAIERAQKQISETAGAYGQNQQTMMQQMMSNWQGALK